MITLQYKLIGSNNTDGIIETTLVNRGINDWDEYLKLNSVDNKEYSGLEDIDPAVKCFAHHVDNGDDIGILFDTDTDGVCSGTIIYKYTKKIAPHCKIHVIVHKKSKAHGLSSHDYAIPKEVKLLIIPDSSSNDIDECQELIDNGVSVIICDHHIKSDERVNPAILINNQTSPNYENKEACGAHITYNFCKALDDYYWEDYADDMLDLVALADIADVMSIKSFQTRAAINVGLANVKNKMFLEILKAQEFSTKGVISPFTISFYISTLINAFLRLATFEERQLLIKAFCEDESETFEYTKRGADFPTEENIYEHVVRLMKSYKGKQDRQRQKAVPQLIAIGRNDDGKVAVIDSTGIIDTSLTGVVAIKISEALNKPTILLQKHNDEDFGGSARAFDNCPITDFRELIDSCPYTTFAQGHPSACGVSIPVKNVEATKQWLNEQLADVDMEKVYDVDFEIDAQDLDIPMFQALDQYKTLWGHNVNEPLFAIKNLHISPANARICGKNQNTIQIYDNAANVKYVMFFCNGEEDLYQWISENWGDEEAVITVVGTLGLSMYDGKLDQQVIIKDARIEETIQN